MTTQATTQRDVTEGRTRSGVLLTPVLAATLVTLVAGTAREADAAFTEKVVFASDRTTGTGVRQLTFNKADRGGQERNGPLYTSQARKEVRRWTERAKVRLG